MMVVITSVGECVIPYPHRRTNKTRITLPPKPPSRVGVHQHRIVLDYVASTLLTEQRDAS